MGRRGRKLGYKYIILLTVRKDRGDRIDPTPSAQV